MRKQRKELEKIWSKTPVDYYQKGVEKNILQKIWHQGRVKETIKLLKDDCGIDKKGLKLLDVGCASGWFLSQVHGRYPYLKCFGVDVYQKAIEHAQKSYSQFSFSQADAHYLPFQEGFFDIVICFNVLEHVINPQKVMKEIKKVVKKNGVVIIGMDSENYLFALVWWIWKKFKGKVWKSAHLHQFKPKDLDKLFKELDFKIKNKKFINLGMMVVYLLKK